MKKMTFRSLLLSALMLFTCWQSFGQGSTDTVYALASNKIQFTAAGVSSTDSVAWFINGTAITTSTAGATFMGGSTDSVLRIDGSLATGFIQPNDSVTAQYNKIEMVVYNAGGCYSDDTSKYQVLVLPFLKQVVIDYDSIALCSQNSLSDSMTATQPAMTGLWNTVSLADFTWWGKDSPAASFAQISTGITVTGNTSKLVFTTPSNTDVHTYHAILDYTLPAGASLIQSAGSTAYTGTTSTEVNIQALPTPTAPTLNGTTVTGW